MSEKTKVKGEQERRTTQKHQGRSLELSLENIQMLAAYMERGGGDTSNGWKLS